MGYYGVRTISGVFGVCDDFFVRSVWSYVRYLDSFRSPIPSFRLSSTYLVLCIWSRKLPLGWLHGKNIWDTTVLVFCLIALPRLIDVPLCQFIEKENALIPWPWLFIVLRGMSRQKRKGARLPSNRKFYLYYSGNLVGYKHASTNEATYLYMKDSWRFIDDTQTWGSEHGSRWT